MFSLIVTPSISFSVPFNGIVSDGSASISGSANGVVINQGTDKAIIDWQGFDVGANESATFKVPNGNSYTLNRIHGEAPSQIYGKVTSNGQLMLINRNGVVFGKEAQVDANGLLATTSDIDNADFMKGHYTFHSGGNANARIENGGTITIKNGGSAALVAPNVKNSGTINASFGKVSLAAGSTFAIDPYGDGLIQLAVSEHMSRAIVENSGTIRAHGGKVQLEASLDDVTDSLINLDGAVDVSNAYGAGGSMTVTGADIRANEAQINASGISGGGKVHLGGGYQGSGKQRHASNVTIGGKTVIKADAAVSGDGGEVIAWSDGKTDFSGTITARGGAKSGNGGLIETSGHALNIVGGSADASAPKGKAGTWLLDPNNITIQTAGFDTNVSASPNFTSTNDNAIVTTGSIETALNGGTSVVVQTSNAGANTQAGDINVTGNITKTLGTDATLTLKAFRDIVINGAQITSTSGKLNIVLNSDSTAGGVGGIYLTAGSLLNSNGGNIVISGGLDPMTGYARGNNAFWWMENGITVNTATLDANGGNIYLRGISTAVPSGTVFGVIGFNSVIQTSGAGSINVNGLSGNGVNADGGVFMANTTLQNANGNITLSGTSALGTAYSVTNQNGSINTAGNILLEGYDVWILGNIFKSGAAATSILAKAQRDVDLNNNAQITSGGGSVDVTFNSNSDAIGAGSIYLGANTVINTNGGNIVLGGGLNPLTDNAIGNSAIVWHKNGIHLWQASLNAAGGNISIHGASDGDPAANAYGAFIANSDILTSGSGTITAYGFLSDGQQGGEGLVTSAANIQATGGDIILTGRVGATSLAGTFAMDIEGGGILNTSGNIRLDAIGGTGVASQNGIYFSGDWGMGTDLLIQTQNGNIQINGAGGASSTNSSYGIWMDGGTNIRSTGTGNVSITGTASLVAPTSESGIYIQDGYFTGGATARISTHDGNLSITGTAAGTDPFDAGINLGGGTVINSDGLGSITLTGNASGGPSGINFNNFNGNVGTNFIGSGATNGNITLRADSLDVTTVNAIQTTGTVNILPVTAGTGIGVAGGAGALAVNTTLLNAINANTISIGSLAGSGAVNLGAYTWNHNAEILSGAGQINVNGAQTSGAHTFSTRTSNADIVLNNTISSSAAGDNIVLAAGNNFINNVGAAALNSTTGRWLIYASSPAGAMLNGLVPTFSQYSSSYATNSPTSILTAGNGVVWASAQAPVAGNNGGGGVSTPIISQPSVPSTPAVPSQPSTPIPAGGNNGVGQPVPVVVAPESIDITLDNYLRNNPVIKQGEDVAPESTKPTQQILTHNDNCVGSSFDSSCSTHRASDLWMEKPLADLLEIDAKWLKLKYGINVMIQ